MSLARVCPEHKPRGGRGAVERAAAGAHDGTGEEQVAVAAVGVGVAVDGHVDVVQGGLVQVGAVHVAARVGSHHHSPVVKGMK